MSKSSVLTVLAGLLLMAVPNFALAEQPPAVGTQVKSGQRVVCLKKQDLLSIIDAGKISEDATLDRFYQLYSTVDEEHGEACLSDGFDLSTVVAVESYPDEIHPPDPAHRDIWMHAWIVQMDIEHANGTHTTFYALYCDAATGT
jgi:hypothetical protein